MVRGGGKWLASRVSIPQLGTDAHGSGRPFSGVCDQSVTALA
jgi:hypothetical protein